MTEKKLIMIRRLLIIICLLSGLFGPDNSQILAQSTDWQMVNADKIISGSDSVNFKSGVVISPQEDNSSTSITRGGRIVLGDVNGDGKCTNDDVKAVIDYIFGRNPQPFIIDNADMDGNGIIDINDVLRLVIRC